MSTCSQLSLPSEASAGSARGYNKRKTFEGVALTAAKQFSQAVSPPANGGNIKRDQLDCAAGVLVFAGQRLVSHRCVKAFSIKGFKMSFGLS